MPRGGSRAGIQGNRYPNRTDLQQNARPLPVQTGPSQQYGQAAQLRRAQQALPMAPPPATPAPPGRSQGAQPPASGAVELVPLDAPTQRPWEPISAGAPWGPGPGPEVLGVAPLGPRPPSLISLLASMPDASPELRALAEEMEVSEPDESVIGFDVL